MAKRPPIPDDKRPLHNSYSNWEFWHVHEDADSIALIYKANVAWAASVAIAVACLCGGAIIAHYAPPDNPPRFIIWTIPVLTSLGMLFLTGWRVERETRLGPPLRLDLKNKSLQLPRSQFDAGINEVDLLLQIYLAPGDEGACAELNARCRKSGRRFAITKVLDFGRDLRRVGTILQKHGVNFAEEDLRNFSRQMKRS